jgi:hypothetical protein
MGVEAVLRNGFSEAIQYKKAWETYNSAKKPKETQGPPLTMTAVADFGGYS